jgi:replicative DNA helicase
VLCSLLLSPREVSDLCVLRLRPDAFYIPAHKIIYTLVIEFSDKSKPIDFVSLKQGLEDRGQLAEIGGPAVG